MLTPIIKFCIRERLVVLLAAGLLIALGWYCTSEVPIDAIPNVSENQVIVFTAWPGRSPKDVEDQVTYPLSVGLLAVPGAESVRGKSLFGYSFVQVTFADDVDFYWARSRVSELLTTVSPQLPDGVAPTLGPDATALGQILYYTLDPPAGMNLAQLRSLQDFVVKYELQAVKGVSEVASVGGYVRQYQVEVDPNKLRFHNISLDQLVKSIRESNIDVGAKTVESTGMEFILRGKGFIGRVDDPDKAVSDIEETVVLSRSGVPVRIRDLGYVQLGPMFRRGAIDLNGAEAVGGVVVMRYGENPRKVIDRVKQKITSVEPSLKGVKINLIYDRTTLIDETISTLTTALWQEILITIAVIVVFLLHIRSSIVVAGVLPIAVLLSFIAMYFFGIDANIMSLAGIAIAIGTIVDMGIIVSENIYRHLSEWENSQDQTQPAPQVGPQSERKQTLSGAADRDFQLADKQRFQIILNAATEVAPAVVTAVSTTVISFLPVFFLTGRDYKLFAPLAWTKTFALIASLLVAVLLVPLLARLLLKSSTWSRRKSLIAAGSFGILMGLGYLLLNNMSVTQHLPAALHWSWALDWGVPATAAVLTLGTALILYIFLRERLRPVEENPVSRFINWVYEPILRFFLGHRLLFTCIPSLIVLLGLGAWFGLPSVLRPFERGAKHLGADMNEVPGYVDFKHLFKGLKSDDWIALDEGSWFYMPTLYPAAGFSLTMQVLQTQDALIKEIPEVENVLGKIGRVDSALDPAPAAMIETYVMLKPQSQWRAGVTARDIWDEINALATLPGVTPASPLQPIEGRVVMLQSGIKAPMAIRIYGDDLKKLAQASLDVAEEIKKLPQVNAGTVNPDIVLGKPYVEFEVDRKAAARFGMSAMMVNQIVEAALGGMNVTKTVEGRERYPIQVRYLRKIRERVEDLKHLPVITHTGEVVPLDALSRMEIVWGPGAVNSENARLVAHVSFSTSGVMGDLETVEWVEKSLRDAMTGTEGQPPTLNLPEGYVLEPVGSFQNQIEANQRLMIIVPLVILANLFIIYMQFRNLPISLAIFSGIPVAFGGGMILLGLYEVEMNTAIWVGFIALFGIAIDDGVVMGTYLNQLFRERKLTSITDIRNATVDAGLKRIRPCLMTTATTIVALIPVLLATGRGADVARAMALPVFGGMLVEIVTLFVVPVLFSSYMEFKMHAGFHDDYWEATSADSGSR